MAAAAVCPQHSGPFVQEAERFQMQQAQREKNIMGGLFFSQIQNNLVFIVKKKNLYSGPGAHRMPCHVLDGGTVGL